ncbi:MAG: porin family protein [Bacteroidota bacterium]
MKKFILCSLISISLLSTTATTAQTTEKGKTSFAIVGGVNFQNFNGKDANGNKLENKLMVGYHAGFNVMIPIAPEFYFQTGLLYSLKGAKNVTDSYTNNYKLSYLEMPLNLVYKAPLGNGFVMLGFGPYLAYCIKGKTKTEWKSGETVDSDIEFKNTIAATDGVNPPYFKAFDAGANIFAGYELANGIYLQLNSQLGLVKINSKDMHFPNEKTSVKNTGFGLSLGYRF